MSITVVVALALLTGSLSSTDLQAIDIHFNESPQEYVLRVQERVDSIEKSILEEERKQWVRDVELKEEYQKYLWEQCQEYELDYELLLSVMYYESRYNENAKNVNTNGTTDTGLMQINSSNSKWVDELADKDIDLKDPYDNILAGVLIFKHYRDYWIDRVEEPLLNQYALNSYNMGIAGYRNAGFPSRSYNRKIEEKATEILEKSNTMFDKQ